MTRLEYEEELEREREEAASIEYESYVYKALETYMTDKLFEEAFMKERTTIGELVFELRGLEYVAC